MFTEPTGVFIKVNKLQYTTVKIIKGYYVDKLQRLNLNEEQRLIERIF